MFKIGSKLPINDTSMIPFMKNISQLSSPVRAVFLCFGVTVLLLYGGAHYFILNSFKQLEAQEMQQNVERAKSLIREELDKINTTCGDYAGWDDAYLFVQGRKKTFIADNLSPETFAKGKHSIIAYYDTSGQPVFEGGYDLDRLREMAFAPGWRQQFIKSKLLEPFESTNDYRTGILQMPEGLLLVAGRPVITSAYKGPIKGTLLMGRLLTQSAAERLAKTLHLSLIIVPAEKSKLTEEFATAKLSLDAGKQTVMRTERLKRIYGYAQLKDIMGEPALLLRVEMPRDIYVKGLYVIAYFMAWIIVCGAVVAGALAWGGERLVATLRRVERSEERHRLVVEQTDQGILLVDPETYKVVHANPAFCIMVGRSKADLVGVPLYYLLDGDPKDHEEALERAHRQKREVSIKHRDGSSLICELTVTEIPGEQGELICLMVHDISVLRRFQTELLHQATHDVLTGLPNRSLLNDRMSQAISSVLRRGGFGATLLIDLDHFKTVNDTMGHAVGDMLLKSVAARLRSFVRSSDTLARLGGDEFVILLSSIPSMGDLITVAENFTTLLAAPFMINDREYFVTASVGIAVFPDDGNTIDLLLKKADTAMYNAKETGRNGFQFFAEEMNRKVDARLVIETQMRKAIERGEMHLHYQPKLNLKTGVISGMEALARWDSQVLGVVSPATFIPVAEDSGLIVQIGEWVMDCACRQTVRFHDQGYTGLRVSINVSTRQFTRNDFVERVAAIIKASGLSPGYVDLEITESALTQSIDDTITVLSRLRQLGVTISIDDFGTGYSSLNYLKRFPIDVLKIDKTFVDDVLTQAEDAAIVSTIIDMAHHMSLSVVAEGVETLGQQSFLKRCGCEEIQGYYFCRPLPAEEIGAFLESHARHCDHDETP